MAGQINAITCRRKERKRKLRLIREADERRRVEEERREREWVARQKKLRAERIVQLRAERIAREKRERAIEEARAKAEEAESIARKQTPCDTCGQKIDFDVEVAYRCGAKGPGEDGCWGRPDQLFAGGGCGEWFHKDCMGTTKCGNVFYCDGCIDDYDCVDCPKCTTVIVDSSESDEYLSGDDDYSEGWLPNGGWPIRSRPGYFYEDRNPHRTKQTARKSTGGKAPRRQLAPRRPKHAVRDYSVLLGLE